MKSRSAVWIATVLLGALLTGFALLTGPTGDAGALGVVVLVGLFSVFGGTLSSAMGGYVVADCLSQFLKRFVFLFGDQPKITYYGIQLLPAVFTVLALAFSLDRLRKMAWPSSAKVFAAFMSLAAVVTVVSPQPVEWMIRGAALYQLILPMAFFFVGMALSSRDFVMYARVLCTVAVVSVAYGVAQWFYGPAAFELRYAESTAGFAIQGRNIYNYMVRGDFLRVYSFYSHHLTWGLLLVAALSAGTILRCMGKISKTLWWILTALVIVGVFLTMTRTVWVALLCTTGASLLLKKKFFRNAGLLWLTLIFAFPLTTISANYIYTNLFPVAPRIENAIVHRYLTVGTVEARMNGLELIPHILQSHAIVGRGFGNGVSYAALSKEIDMSDAQDSHNSIVDLLYKCGILGVALFVLFQFLWFRHAFKVYSLAGDGAHRSALRWHIGFAAGYFLVGYFNGSVYLNGYYYIMLGFVAGMKQTVSWCYFQVDPREDAPDPAVVEQV